MAGRHRIRKHKKSSGGGKYKGMGKAGYMSWVRSHKR